MIYRLEKKNREIVGTIELTGSKSICNRALIIRALSKEPFPIHRMAAANDTFLLSSLLESKAEKRDAGPAGTTFRFLTAFLSLQPGTQVLTGSERMKQRPIGVLVDALRHLGADISYLEKEGYPPLKIGVASSLGKNQQLTISAGTSSQYISALLMIAPTLPNGLKLTLEGKIVSRPYIEMTLNLMKYFGVSHQWEGAEIDIPPQEYQARPFTVEADWSAASYYYALAAFADRLDLQLNGLFEDSVQGDAVLAEMMEHFGIQTTYNETGVHLTKSGSIKEKPFKWDFIRCPDLAQTLAVVCAGLGVPGQFQGLETLRIKETDRIAALQTELDKVFVRFWSKDEQLFTVEGLSKIERINTFDTYEDHRMAMAFAPLGMINPIQIAEPMVVKKSYPDFYEDFRYLGFSVEEVG